MKLSRTAALVCILVATSSLMAQANPKLLKAFVAKYPATTGTKLAKCATCHVKAPALNVFGKDLKAAHGKFEEIEAKDSDQDRVSNLAEIKGLTLPGDPKDKPAAESKTDSTAAAPKDSSGASPDTAKSPPR